MGYIYKITNQTNGKVYIGQTIRTIAERWKEHLERITQKEELNEKSIQYAILQNGVKNFTIEKLEECENEKLDDREIYWINYYRSYVGWEDNQGYNLTTGGGNGLREGVSVDQFSLDGEYIQSFISCAEAARVVNGNISPISDVCKGKHKTACGFQWRYLEDRVESLKPVIVNDNGKWIDQFSLENEYIQTFPSAAEAARAVGVVLDQILQQFVRENRKLHMAIFGNILIKDI